MRRDVEDALRQIFLFQLSDQDRVIAIIQDPVVEEWLLDPEFGAVLIHANSRRHDNISPASAACALFVHTFSNTITQNRLPIITLYWFCGLHSNEPEDGALRLLRSLVCQLLSTGPFDHGFRQMKHFDGQDLGKLLDLFVKLLQQLPEGTAVICIIDGISYYEDSRIRQDTLHMLGRLIKLSRAETPIFKLLIASPTRTGYIHYDPSIEKYLKVVEIPQHVNGAKQGFNHRAVVASTEEKVRRLSKTMPVERRADTW